MNHDEDLGPPCLYCGRPEDEHDEDDPDECPFTPEDDEDDE